MGKNVPVGGVEVRAVHALPVLGDGPKRVAKLLHVAGNSVEVAYDSPDEVPPIILCELYLLA